jgi:hypothetical protein
VFEIGNSLREARLRQQLEFPEIEKTTKIRSKYLRALEEEKFDLLPAPTYVKGFLRTYADALGLEGQLYVDEYNSRFVTGEEDVPLRPRDYQRRPPSSAGHRFETRGIVVTVGAIAVAGALVIGAWKWGSNENPRVPGLNAKAPGLKAAKKHRRHARPMARLILTATDGDSWLLVRANSQSGPTKYEGTLQQGQEIAFTKRPFVFRRWWIAIAKPKNIVAQVNGHVRLIPGTAKLVQVIVTPTKIVKAPPAT